MPPKGSIITEAPQTVESIQPVETNLSPNEPAEVTSIAPADEKPIDASPTPSVVVDKTNVHASQLHQIDPAADKLTRAAEQVETIFIDEAEKEKGNGPAK